MTNYMQPNPQFPTLPGSVNFTDFLQAVFTGISGIDGKLVRPDWQPAPPKMPDIDVNWLAIGLEDADPDANAYVGSVVAAGPVIVNVTQRMEKLAIKARFYGPQAYELMGLTRDGFQIPSNLIALTQAGMGFVGTSKGHRVPELINERWFDSWEMGVYMNRQILRSYPILTFLSVSGSIQAVLDSGNLKTGDWQTNL